jgi:hypothetical protein
VKKDIAFPEVKNVAIAIAKEDSEDSVWSVFLINLNPFPLKSVFISSRGYGEIQAEARETSKLRWFFEEIGPNEAVRVEAIVEEVFGLHNEYWVSYFVGGQVYDKRFVFLAESIKESNFTSIPILKIRGVMIS